MRIRSFALSLALSSLCLAACGGGDDAQPTPAPTPEATPAPTPEPTPEATPAAAAAGQMSDTLKAFLGTVSEADKARTNPKAGDAKALADGKAQYEMLCIACHGPAGKGDGPAAAALKPPAADLTDAGLNAQVSSGQRFAILKQGIPNTAMQAFGAALPDDMVWSIVAYAESLGAAAPAPAGDPAAAAPAAPAAPATH